MDVNRKLNVSFVGLFLLLTKGWKTLVFVLVACHYGSVGIRMGQKKNVKLLVAVCG